MNVFPFVFTNTNVPRFRPCGPGGGRLPPLQWGYHDWGHTIHPHRLYIQRGGRQVAAPTGPSDVYRFVGTVLVSKRGGRQIAAPTCTSVSGTVHPHGL